MQDEGDIFRVTRRRQGWKRNALFEKDLNVGRAKTRCGGVKSV